MDGILVTTENLLASGGVNLPLSLSFAALRGDDWLLHQLLNRGLDPNESDNKGRTALVRESETFLFVLPPFIWFDSLTLLIYTSIFSI